MPQVEAFGREGEFEYFAPAFRFPTDGPGPFIPVRPPSFTEIGSGDLQERLRQETVAAYAQVTTVRSMPNDIVRAAEKA